MSQVYYLSFKYSSACFGHPHAHHQELQQLQQQPLVYRSKMVAEVLLVVVGPDHDQQHCYHHARTVNQRLLLWLLSS
jgi:hypothetical protein